MANPTQKTSKTVNPRDPEEAFLALQIIASFKKHALKVNKTGQIVEIRHRHERFLYLVFYLVLILIPLFIVKDSLKGLYPILFAYYFLFFLLIWNITRGTKGLKIDREKKQISFSNLDIFGKILHPAKEFHFDDVNTFEPAFESGHFGSSGKNMIQVKTKKNKNYPVFRIKSEGAGLTNGKIVSGALNILSDLSN